MRPGCLAFHMPSASLVFLLPAFFTPDVWSRSVRLVRRGCLCTSISPTRVSICLPTRCRLPRTSPQLHLAPLCARAFFCAPGLPKPSLDSPAWIYWLTAGPLSFSPDALRSWITRNTSVPSQRQILMTARGKNVKIQTLATEVWSCRELAIG